MACVKESKKGKLVSRLLKEILKICISFDPEISFLWLCPSKIIMQIDKDDCMKMFIKTASIPNNRKLVFSVDQTLQ